MSSIVVVDASVAVKRAVSEEHSYRAAAVLDLYERGMIVGLSNLKSEVTNALYQRTRRRHDPLGERDAEVGLERIMALGIDLFFPDALYPQAVAFAGDRGLCDTYDATYVVLAEVLGRICGAPTASC